MTSPNTRIPFLLLLVSLAGCVASVTGPGGAPLTDVQIEQLAGHELTRFAVTGCRWRHAGADTTLTAGTHERICADAGYPSDSTHTYVTYAPERHGRWALRISDKFIGERCRVDRPSAADLGTLHCWAERRY